MTPEATFEHFAARLPTMEGDELLSALERLVENASDDGHRYTAAIIREAARRLREAL